MVSASLRSRRVFVDSSAYLALRDRRDANHDQAVTIFTRLTQLRFRQLTSTAILLEAHSLILSELGISNGQSFLREMEESNTILVRLRQQDEERAKQIVYTYADKDFSLVDASSFVVMERLGMSYAFTFDRHFSQYGFIQLTAEILS